MWIPEWRIAAVIAYNWYIFYYYLLILKKEYQQKSKIRVLYKMVMVGGNNHKHITDAYNFVDLFYLKNFRTVFSTLLQNLQTLCKSDKASAI